MEKPAVVIFLFPVFLPLFAAPTVPLHEVYEITLIGSEAENPYLSFRLWADFTGPEGRTFSIEGFWDGGRTWKIRAVFEQIGQWTYLTHSDDLLLDGKSGTIECIAGPAKGFVRQSGRHFFYADGTPFFRMGDTCWRIFRSKNAPYESRFKPYINARAQQGFNLILGVIHTVGDPSINEGGSLWYNDTDLNRLQPGYFQWVDKRVEYMLRAGIIPGLVFVWAQRFEEFYRLPYHRDTFSRFRRYIVARYAAYNVFWILAGEYSETMSASEYDYHARAIRFGNHNPAAGLLDCGDPYGHPLSIHPSGQESNSQHFALFHDWLSNVSQQLYGSPAFLHQQVMNDSFTGLPICNDEFGYEGPTNPRDPYYYFNNQSAADTRRDAWAIVCGGGYFTWGNIYTYTGKELILRTDKLYSPGAEYMRLLSKYVRESLPFHEMSPKQVCILNGEAYCLAKEGERYVIYFPTTAPVTFNLQAGDSRYKAVWFNPTNGDTAFYGLVFGNQTYRVSSPFGDDGLLDFGFFDHHTIRLRLLEFSAEPTNDSTVLTWRCFVDCQTAGFIVERAEVPVMSFRPITSLISVEEFVQAEGDVKYYRLVDFPTKNSGERIYRLNGISLDGEKEILAECTAKDRRLDLPNTFRLAAAPNPAKGSLYISVDSPIERQGEAAVYDITGRRIRLLYSGSFEPGISRWHWDGRDDHGREAAAGVYLISLKAEGDTQVVKCVLCR